MLSLQEIIDKTKDLNRIIGDKGIYHPEMMSTLEMKDQIGIRETLNKLSLASLLEYMVRSGATTTGGVAGANYLFAAKMHDTLIAGSRRYDICPEISAQVVTGWEGADMTVNVFEDETRFSINSAIGGSSSAGKAQARGGVIVKCTLTPKLYTCLVPLTQDLIEDGGYDLVQWYTQNAGEVCGRVASQWAISRLKNVANGDGTQNSVTTSAAGITEWAHTVGDTDTIVYAMYLNAADNFITDTVLTQGESWHDAMIQTLNTGSTFMPPKLGYNANIDGMYDIIVWPYHQDLLGAADHLQTIVFNRQNALLTARKRWLQVENIFDAPTDIENIVVSFRQDSTTLYKDAQALVTEL